MSVVDSGVKKPIVVFVLGPPGSGKGTQCQRIADQYKYRHLSAGELLRAEQERDSEYSRLIDAYIREGKIVPVDITCNLLWNAMMDSANETNKFLVDGFPRNQDNLDGWKRIVGDRAKSIGILFFECGSEECVRRCLDRGKSSQRTDDNRQSLLKRMETYRASTLPIVEQCEQVGQRVLRIDAAGTVDEVWQKVVDSNIFQNNY